MIRRKLSALEKTMLETMKLALTNLEKGDHMNCVPGFLERNINSIEDRFDTESEATDAE
jgi:hypothetical protein